MYSKLVPKFAFLRRDIKPDNILMGKEGASDSDTLYLIDLGLAKRFYSEDSGHIVSEKTRKNLTGTARYASVGAHKGMALSRRDDMISMAYVSSCTYTFSWLVGWMVGCVNLVAEVPFILQQKIFLIFNLFSQSNQQCPQTMSLSSQ